MFKPSSMKKFIVMAGIAIASPLLAQDDISDASRMMRPDLSGTARSLGVGGAFSTVGADMSSMNSNPAGLGLYRSNEIALSGGAVFGNTGSQYLGIGTSDNFSKGSISQAGIVFTTKQLSKYENMGIKGGLERVVFGIGFQKVADFNRNDYYYGVNTKSSYAQALAADINGTASQNGIDITNPTNVNPYNFALQSVNAFNSAIVDYTDTTQTKVGPKISSLPVNQASRISTQGSLSDINLSLGFNIGNTLYIGLGLGLPYMSYSRYSTFAEGNASSDSVYSMVYNTSNTGIGVNGKFGIIAKPTPWLRLGASVQTPTYFSMSQTAYGNGQTQLGDTTGYQAENSTLYKFAYYNPGKLTFGASAYLKQWGFVSVDYELTDYTHTHYSFSGQDKTISDQENAYISAQYKIASTIKAGAEFSYKKLRLRAGFAWSESPFRSGVGVSGYDGARYNYTAGIGYRGQSFFADLAYVRTQYKDYYSPYAYKDAMNVIQEPGVYNNSSVNTIVATVGFKFGSSSKNKTTTRRRVMRNQLY